MKTLIVQGSARSDGNSRKISNLISSLMKADFIDLNTYSYSGYDYSHSNHNDEFITVMKQIVNYDVVIFVTPVYWYSMSGLMKNFFDRITDCLKMEKEIGRKLRGMSMAAISCGSDDIQTEGFFVPFRNSAAYLGMFYLGDLHTWIDDGKYTKNVEISVFNFINSLKESFTNI